jgi:phosphate transport system substrate-binding protein
MKGMKIILTVMTAAALLSVPAAFTFAGGGQEGGGSGSVRLSMGGSTTMEPIMSSAMEVYRMEIDSAAELSYDAPGSTAGIRGVLNGTYDLGCASRELFIDEKQQGVQTTPIALDGLAVIVNDTVPIDDISLENLAAIYVGEIKNWSKVGGPDEKIVVVNRDEASGTLGAFREAVLERVYGDDARFILNALVTESNGNMATMVSQTPYSIGYASMHVLERLRETGGKDLTVNGIRDIPENVYNGSYPISRPLNVVTYGEPGGDAKMFLEFLLSERGQEIVREVRYLPLR